jgi:WD40 repeat protein
MRTALGWFLSCLLLTSPGGVDEPDTQPADVTEPDPAETKGKPILVLDTGGHTAPVQKVLFTPDGKQVISISKDKTIRFWSTQTGDSLRVLRPAVGYGASGELHAGALSPDGRILAIGGWGLIENDKRIIGIQLITMASGAVRTLQGHTQSVAALAFSNNGKYLASGSHDHTVCIWDLDSGRCLHTLEGHKDTVHALAFSPTGDRLATVSPDGTGRVWSVQTGKAEAVLQVPGRAPRQHSVAWSPDGKTIVTGGHDDRLRLWSPRGKLAKVISLGQRGCAVFGLVFATEANRPMEAEVLATWRRAVRENKQYEYSSCFVNLATGKVRPALAPRQSTLMTSPSTAIAGPLVATTGGDDHAIWLCTHEGKVLFRLGGDGQAAVSAAWSSDGKQIAWGRPRQPGDGQVPLQHAFDPSALTFSHKVNPEQFRGAWTSMGTLTATQTANRVLEIREADKELTTIRGKNGAIHAFTFLPGDRVAVAAFAQNIIIYDARTGKDLHHLLSHRSRVTALAASPDGKYLLSVAFDETIRITPITDTRPLLALFSIGSEWIAWTQQGYYAASAGGEKLMGWQTGGGTQSLASFYPAAHFRKTFYRPDVIEKLLALGSVEKALVAADRARGVMKSQVVEVADVLPPEVLVAAAGPKDGKLTEPRLEIEATARGKGQHPVTSLQLLLDGRPYPGIQSQYKAEGPKAGVAVKHAWKVELPEGDHTVRVLARSDASMGLSNELELSYAKPAAKARLFLLAVGIDEYMASGLKLHCAVQDATELGETVDKKSRALFDVQCKVLTNPQATRAGILAGLKWLKGGMKAQDVAVIFYAGHGEKDDKGHFFLLPQDVVMDKMADTAISAEKLKEHLADLPGRVVLLLDACHSGAIGKVINDMARDLADEDCGVVVLCAALGSERAGEADGHGFFCKALLEVLKGEHEAPKNPRDGCVYLHHVEQYVIDRVQELSKDEQHPTAAKPALRPLALAKP